MVTTRDVCHGAENLMREKGGKDIMTSEMQLNFKSFMVFFYLFAFIFFLVLLDAHKSFYVRILALCIINHNSSVCLPRPSSLAVSLSRPFPKLPQPRLYPTFCLA